MVTSRFGSRSAEAELWERWRTAKCCGHLAALERKNKTGVERIVVLHGGIGPAPRREPWQH